MAEKIKRQPVRPPTQDGPLLSWLRDKYDRGRASMPERQWKLQLCFVRGHQWLEWDGAQRRFDRAATPDTSRNAPVRITVNKLAPLLERQVAKLTKNAPLPECRPVSDDDQDTSAARVGTRILGHEMDRLDWDDWLVAFMFWPGTLSISYAHIYWDPEAGEPVGELPLNDEAPEEGTEDIFEGNVCLEAVPAFELGVQPGSASLEDALWCVRTTTMSDEAIFERWGIEPKRDDDEPPARSIADEVLALDDQSEQSGGNAGYMHAVHQFWMKPCRAAPDGLVVTWTGNTILEKYDFPYAHGRLPFVEMTWMPGIGTRLGRTWISDAISMQYDYNDARSRMAAFRRTLVPKLLAPTGSIDPTRVTSRVEVITYNPTGAPPSWSVPDSSWMNQFEATMQRADVELSERAGQSEASQGQGPSTQAAAAILALQEADDTKLAITAKSLASFIKNVGWQILMLTKQYWTEQRTVRVYSEENQLEAWRYSGSDIASRFDVHVSAESGLPRSKTARTQLAFELFSIGAFPGGVPDLIRYLDLPGTDFIIRQFDLDLKRQQRELVKLIAGEEPEVREFDNHAVHMQGIDQFRKTLDYEQLPDDAKARIDAHWGVHAGWVMPQQNSPGPPGDFNPEQAAPAEQAIQDARAGIQNTPYNDAATGQPPTSTERVSGQAPSPVSDQGIYQDAGIGTGAGAQGRVPGVPADTQAAATGN